jgi:hypothetical protein
MDVKTTREQWLKSNIKKGLLIVGGFALVTLSSKFAEAKDIYYKSTDGSKVKIGTTTRFLQVTADLRGVYATSATWKLLDMETATALYPNGITINSIVVKCSSTDPTTELNANIMYCDAQGTGAFPGANPTLIKAIDTTAGNMSDTSMTTSVATNKIIYLLMDADPVDLNTTWTISIGYQIN